MDDDVLATHIRAIIREELAARYDAELGKITDRDCEEAEDMLEDLDDDINDRATQLRTAAMWLRKVRYEAVIADRKSRR